MIVDTIGHTAHVYTVQKGQSLDDIVSIANRFMIDRLVQQWALEETEDLLDYVYTDTEPMRFATFGQELDFTTIRREIVTNRPTKHLKLEAEKSSKIQKLLQEKRAKQKRRTISEPVYDEAYFEAMKAMDDEDIEILGKIKISAETADAISQQTE